MRVLVITGAGISAESGIPTFRGKDGYWRKLDPASLATPEAFARNPGLVWEWYRERRAGIRKAEPNAAHEAIVRLANGARDFLLVTQNVDDLHTRARWNGKQLREDHLVQIHGDIFVTRCSRCDRKEHEDELATASPSSGGQEPERELPRCLDCGALMRPGVVWFGEQLDLANIHKVEDFLARGDCDAVLVIGTTAMFGYIGDWAVRGAGDSGQLFEINPETTPLSDVATECVRERAAVALPGLVERILARSA